MSTKKKACPMAFVMLTSQAFRPRFTASKVEAMNKRAVKISVNNYQNF